MATYKVIQDIEAEDKFLGPLTLKQFIFGAGGAFFAYLNVFALTKGFPYAMILFVPPMLLGFFLAFPWSKDQPTEVWVIAKLRFRIKPRKRIWDQSGMEELVTITAPKKIEKQLTDNLSQIEVKSRLSALAQTIDSRGWVIKDTGMIPAYQQMPSDRLVSPSTLPHEVPPIDIANIPDVYTEATATSANFDRMIEQSTEMRKAQNLEKMDRIRSGEPLESIVLPEIHFTPPSLSGGQPYVPPTVDEQTLSEQLKNSKAPDAIAKAHMRTINPISTSAPTQDDSAHQSAVQDDTVDSQNPRSEEPPENLPTPQSTAILEYAGNNDLNIATIARQAKKDVEGEAGEVVVSLR